MRILITGGFGYLGSRLAVYFTSKGHEVILGSRSQNISPTWLPESKVVQIDWSDSNLLMKACEGVDHIIHASGMNSYDSEKNPILALEANGLASAKLAYAASKTSVKRFIYFSTVHVYKTNLVGNIGEKNIPENLHPYATSKIAAEQSILGIASQSDLDCLILRLSNLVGPPAHKNVNVWNLLANDLCLKMLNKKRVYINNPFQLRDFVTISAFQEFMSKSLNMNFEIPIINICSGESMTILAFSNLLKEVAEDLFGIKVNLYTDELLPSKYENDLNITSMNPYPILNNRLRNEIQLLFHFCAENFL